MDKENLKSQPVQDPEQKPGKTQWTTEELKQKLLDEQDIMVLSKLKRIHFADKHFVANGKIYYIEDIVAPRRWAQLLRYEVELGFGQTFENIYKAANKGFNSINDGRMADAAVGYHNIIHMCKNGLEERVPAALRMCAVCMNTADEDRKILTDQMIKIKMDDWAEEGIAIVDFFDFAANTIPGYINVYKNISLATSQQQPEKSDNQ